MKQRQHQNLGHGMWLRASGPCDAAKPQATSLGNPILSPGHRGRHQGHVHGNCTIRDLWPWNSWHGPVPPQTCLRSTEEAALPCTVQVAFGPGLPSMFVGNTYLASHGYKANPPTVPIHILESERLRMFSVQKHHEYPNMAESLQGWPEKIPMSTFC